MPFECRRSFPLIGAFIVVYVTAWTVITSLLDPSVPYDALEALNWAYAGEFGSPKNPYFVSCVMSLGLLLEPVIPISVYWYLSHFIGVGTGMLGVWLLGKRLFGDNQIAMLSLLTQLFEAASMNQRLTLTEPWLLTSRKLESRL